MNLPSTYKVLFKGFFTGLLIAVFFANATAPYWGWLNGADPETFEICDPIDSESEKEEKKIEEDKYDKIQVPIEWSQIIADQRFSKNFLTTGLLSIYHPEIHTPPPEWV